MSDLIHRVASGGRRMAPPLVFGAMLAASLLLRCSDRSGGAVATGAGGCSSGVCDGAGAGGQSGAGAGGMWTGSPGDGGYPNMRCSDATVNTDCPLPHSVCTGWNGLTYFTAPTCDHGTCRWGTSSYGCPWNCIGGSCEARGTFNPPGDGGASYGGAGGAAGTSGTPNGGGGTLSSGGAGGALNSGGGGLVQPSPTYRCADAGVAGNCPAPPSACADASTLITYDRPSCANGTCSWRRHSVPCQDACQAGHCVGGHADSPLCVTSSVSACALPASQCLDKEMLLYFSDSKCVDAGSGLQCAMEAHVLDCGSRGCMDGGCAPRFTLAL